MKSGMARGRRHQNRHAPFRPQSRLSPSWPALPRTAIRPTMAQSRRSAKPLRALISSRNCGFRFNRTQAFTMRQELAIRTVGSTGGEGGIRTRTFRKQLTLRPGSRITRIFIFLRGNLFCLPSFPSPPVPYKNRHQTDTKTAEKLFSAAKTAMMAGWKSTTTPSVASYRSALDGTNGIFTGETKAEEPGAVLTSLIAPCKHLHIEPFFYPRGLFSRSSAHPPTSSMPCCPTAGKLPASPRPVKTLTSDVQRHVRLFALISPGLAGFQLPTSCAPIIAPNSTSVRRDRPLQITTLPGGGSLARARYPPRQAGFAT